ncbi:MULTISPECIES: dTDP-4-amino-4,6-dideoxygalactose transaminase [unclassified Escherichia]|uniref:dTDP-4-amino-4,6-dideoxygalactose transaminase n=1 Tax=unclassified Escherichia TaxID=2608889 RepID=UPI00102A1F4C|nr:MULTISPECIES: dTDP-4-amino-4,6-dideoxygalactose transaminase [unclassified Escherichia]RZN20152.1 dTDP-4-amino-4,6-dideoxygalactose transaminase [Escherichia sp. E14S1]TBR68640.1 dTDP-4-amino-4,6-dideoxygalactose transaminase [Escherichia sp. E10V4]TGB99520.1 dTDP-4-amino-4,6-dideoxygalactose transaminase [Escherichia sp. E2661]TLI71853.1 dTDP-4-amino-4,6-dideoxygalactose transaminase [Escherichia sp. E1130]TLI75165.1 dTDP-4-amino-4,6-dideoxygalactose transaminase [Escherichia sp. E2586]
MIPFNKPYLHGNELKYISEAVSNGKISGDGIFTKKCHDFFQEKYGFQKALLTTSCTDALEMAAILLDIKPGDEVIAPAYTFVSTVNAFALRGAKIIFADSYDDNPNMDPESASKLITNRTKAIIVVHYAGVACDMDRFLEIAKEYGIHIVEDAAQAIDSYYKDRPLGSIGTFGTFSFHETKNIISGEGGLIVLNDGEYSHRAEIIREKGTNRASFFRGEVNKYGWVDIGSSFLPSDIIAAYLYAQLENIETIQNKRKELWNEYYSNLNDLASSGYIQLPKIPEYATNNAHMFYILCHDLKKRSELISYLKENKIHSVFHYLSLNKSEYYIKQNEKVNLKNSDKFSDCLLRLPMYYELESKQVNYISEKITEFFKKNA